MLIKVVTIYLLLRFVSAQDAGGSTCEQLREAFNDRCDGGLPETPRIQGAVGKRGPKGFKGEAGPIGPSGPPAIVDYDAINTGVERQVETALGGLTAKIEELAGKLEGLSTSLCPIYYNGRCLLLLVKNYNGERINHQQAKEMCDNIGWKLANVYDRTQYEVIEEYMRSRISSSKTYLTAWIGMTWNLQSRQAYYTDGEAASYSSIQWYPSFPNPTPSYTKMGIHINKNPSSTSQGIHNFSPSYSRNGAVCELQ